MNGNRVTRFRHNPPHRTLEKTATHNTLPGVHIMRRSEPTSRPRPLRGSSYASLDPDPSLAFVCTEPGNEDRPVTNFLAKRG